jgi:hypothetical protein
MAQKKIPVKYFLYGMAITALLIAGAFYFLWQKEAGEEKLLKEKGITADAWVLSLHVQTSNRKKGQKMAYQHFMDVAVFTGTAAAKPVTRDTAVSKAKNGSDLVDKLFNKMHSTNKPMGDYTTISIPIHAMAYKKYREDDKVKIVYLKEDPSIARLQEEL